MILNATFTALIFFCIGFHQRSFPFFLVQSQGFLHSLGHLDPKLVCHLMVSFLTPAMILCLFFRTWVVHQENAGSSLIPIASAYSAISTGYDSFMLLNLSHEVYLSIHPMQSRHPLVFLCLYVLPCNVTSWLSLETSLMSFL